jgi:hypothetical protein
VHTAGPCRDSLAVGAEGLVGDLTCRQFVELITDYLEGALAHEMVGQVVGHILICQGCATYLEQMRATMLAVRALRAA